MGKIVIKGYLHEKDRHLMDEMARISSKGDGLPFDVYVYSADHSPPHAHIVRKGGSDKEMFLLTDVSPSSPEDIVSYRSEITLLDKKEIAKWAGKTHKKAPELTNWKVALILWKLYHSK